jgi:very-short-patch-repair endonuclease
MTTPKEIIDAAIQNVSADRHRIWRDQLLPMCESPIEALFLAAVFASNIDWGDNPVHIYTAPYCPDTGRFEGDHLWPQTQIENYRVDFLFEHVWRAGRRRVIVEIDGHDFHEKTREQAAADKARDRFLVARGYRVLRFSGSEVYRDPFCCWAEARSVLWDVAKAA